MRLFKLFKELSLHPKNVVELKGLILQLAVQGKLTAKWRAQNPGVEPAADLLKRIQVEKERLVADKKIRKEKVLPPIEETDKPYLVPHGWVWCRMQETGMFERGKSKHRPRNDQRLFIDGKYPLVQTGDVFSAKKTSGKITQNGSFYNAAGLAQSRMWNKGTLCITIAANIAETGFLAFDACFPDSVVGYTDLIDNGHELSKYVECFITVTKSDLEKFAPLTAQKNINLGILSELKFPLPPLQEQKAIVEVVNELFTEVEQLESLTKNRITLKQDFATSALRRLTNADNTAEEWDFLQTHFPAIFTEKENIKKLRETILQLAVQGKLTAQWRSAHPEAEHASALLQRIQAEKQQLIKEKKIKKEKPLPPIKKGDVPYELPEGWIWCRIGSFLLYSDSGKSPDCEKRPVSNDEWGVLTTTSIQQIKFVENANKVLPVNFEINPKQIVAAGNILITRAGPINRTGIACKVEALKYNLILSDKTIRLNYGELNVSPDYIVLALNSLPIRALLLRKMIGMASSQVNISQASIKSTYFPFPPLSEQKAIVKKVNALMSLCDELEQQTKQSQTQIEQLMQSCLKEVFEK